VAVEQALTAAFAHLGLSSGDDPCRTIQMLAAAGEPHAAEAGALSTLVDAAITPAFVAHYLDRARRLYPHLTSL
jgi:hypothetical protein